MLKEILKLKGAQKLTVSEQKSINAGDVGMPCESPQGPPCGPGRTTACVRGVWVCVPICSSPYCY
ncbi:hypothetical protein [Flavobacterium aestivum]|uniref:hypothetical protein n=1 Tax=Flavobacterium aestivum TaxID=3003257 RepID=UPI0022863857|nr:hypothetical protein [Flavobacterium aestivum]